MEPYLIAIIGLVGACVGAASFVLTTWLIQRTETQKAIRLALLQAAIENWHVMGEEWKRLNEKGIPAEIPPLETYILHMIKGLDAMSGKSLTPKRARKIVRDMREISTAAGDELKKVYVEEAKQKRATHHK